MLRRIGKRNKYIHRWKSADGLELMTIVWCEDTKGMHPRYVIDMFNSVGYIDTLSATNTSVAYSDYSDVVKWSIEEFLNRKFEKIDV